MNFELENVLNLCKLLININIAYCMNHAWGSFLVSFFFCLFSLRCESTNQQPCLVSLDDRISGIGLWSSMSNKRHQIGWELKGVSNVDVRISAKNLKDW